MMVLQIYVKDDVIRAHSAQSGYGFMLNRQIYIGSIPGIELSNALPVDRKALCHGVVGKHGQSAVWHGIENLIRTIAIEIQDRCRQ